MVGLYGGGIEERDARVHLNARESGALCVRQGGKCW